MRRPSPSEDRTGDEGEGVNESPTAPRPFVLSRHEHFILLLRDGDWDGLTLVGRPVTVDDSPASRRSETDEVVLADIMRELRERGARA